MKRITPKHGNTYVLLVAQEDGGDDGRLQGVVEGGHEVIHSVVVPETAQVAQHQLNLAIGDEHQHEAANGKEPQQQTHELTIETLQVGRRLVLLDRPVALAKVEPGGDEAKWKVETCKTKH